MFKAIMTEMMLYCPPHVCDTVQCTFS